MKWLDIKLTQTSQWPFSTQRINRLRKNKQAEKEIRDTTPISIVTNNIKYLGVTLTKDVKDVYESISKRKTHSSECLQKETRKSTH